MLASLSLVTTRAISSPGHCPTLILPLLPAASDTPLPCRQDARSCVPEGRVGSWKEPSLTGCVHNVLTWLLENRSSRPPHTPPQEARHPDRRVHQTDISSLLSSSPAPPCRGTGKAPGLTLPLRASVCLGLCFPPLQNGNNVNPVLSGRVNESVNEQVLCEL